MWNRSRPSTLTDDQRATVHGLLHARGTPVWRADHAYEWQRQRAVQDVVERAVAEVLAGKRSSDGAPNASPPRWLPALCRGYLTEASAENFSVHRFRFVRRLERLGLVAPDHDDTWVLAALSGVDVQCRTRDVLDYLTEDPELREELVWRLFEVEGGGQVSLANVDSFGEAAWRGAFLVLVEDGTLPRDRVLSSCLEALGRDFNRYRAQWFTATWQALEPTDPERHERVGLLLGALRSSAPPVVSFAVRELAAAQRAGPLDAARVLPALEPAVQARAKGTALAALRLGTRVAGDGHDDALLPLARAALDHPHVDVQAAAGRLLSARGLEDSITAAASWLSPVALDRLGRAPTLTTRPGEGWEQQPFVPAAPHVAPVGEAEVVELAATLLEDAAAPGAVEALLGALASIATPAAALAPLVTRARRVVRASPAPADGIGGVPAQVAGLVLATVGEDGPGVPGARHDTPALHHLRARFAEVGEILAGRREPAPLLATPDLPGGLVSAAAVLDRAGARRELPRHDVTAALLRLGGPGRDQVLDRLGRLVRPEVLEVARLPLTGPASHARLVHRFTREYGDRYPEMGLTDVADGDGPLSLQVRPHGSDLAAWLGLLAGILPHDAEHFAALAHAATFRGTRHPSPERDVARVLDLLAAHPGRHGDLSATVVALGLASARGDQRVVAVDALVDLVTTSRLSTDAVGDALARHHELLPAPRWAESLAAAGAAAGSALPVAVLSRTLPGLPTATRGLHAPLELLLAETMRAGHRVQDPPLLDWLGTFRGSSKAARAARRLLAG